MTESYKLEIDKMMHSLPESITKVPSALVGSVGVEEAQMCLRGGLQTGVLGNDCLIGCFCFDLYGSFKYFVGNFIFIFGENNNGLMIPILLINP